MLDYLRNYQEFAVDKIREAFEKIGRRVLLHLATGAGKTVIFCYILKKLHEQKVKALMVVRGRKLVDQASRRLHREGVEHGVMMANHWRHMPYLDIQICSIDTLTARGYHPKKNSCKEKCNGFHLEAEMIIIDEAHQATTEAYKDFLGNYPPEETLILSVTATPYGPKTLKHLADAVVRPISMLELIAEGYLVPARYFCPSMPDLSKVRIDKKGDYNQVQLAEAMDKSELIGDVVDHYLRIAKGIKFLCFCVNIAHSEHMAARFREAGVRVVHCDADTPDALREKYLDDLDKDLLDGICNVNIFATGVDIPFLPCIISARATQSYNLYVQQAGRGTRPIYKEGMPLSTKEERLAAIAAGPKQNFIYLDHAGNVLRHGFITDEQEANVGPDAIRIGITAFAVSTPITTCWKCFAGYRGEACPNGCPPPVVEITGENDGELEEITNIDPEELFIQRLKLTQKQKKYKQGWVYYKFLDRFGKERADARFPVKKVPQFVRDKLEQKRLSDAATQFLKEKGYANA